MAVADTAVTEGRVRVSDEEERLFGAARLHRLQELQEPSGCSHHHHGMAVQDEILVRLAGSQILAADARRENAPRNR